MADKTIQYNGIGFLGLLALLFITLKLLGKITWSWWWVLAPIWVVDFYWDITNCRTINFNS